MQSMSIISSYGVCIIWTNDAWNMCRMNISGISCEYVMPEKSIWAHVAYNIIWTSDISNIIWTCETWNIIWTCESGISWTCESGISLTFGVCNIIWACESGISYEHMSLEYHIHMWCLDYRMNIWYHMNMWCLEYHLNMWCLEYYMNMWCLEYHVNIWICVILICNSRNKCLMNIRYLCVTIIECLKIYFYFSPKAKIKIQIGCFADSEILHNSGRSRPTNCSR